MRWYTKIFMNGLQSSGEIEIREALSEEWEEAMELVWNTFLKFEAAAYGAEGTENFLKFISGEELFQMFLNGDYKVCVAVKDKKIVGVGAMRSHNHVSLLFVDSKMHKSGIGRKLLKFMQETFLRNGTVAMSVNAAPYALEFYKKVGFVETDVEQHVDGIIFYPMVCLSQIK